MAMIILIPSYQPDHRLVDLVRDLRRALPRAPVLVVDDGSGPRYAAVFAQARALGAEVLTGDVNRGKGHALKAGFAHLRTAHPGQGVVCADSDGQHTVTDILRVGDAIAPGTMVLGARQFVGAVPLRSRVGNEATRWIFAAATGQRLRDTQTGLRAYPADLLGWLTTVPGERFEYEMAVLLAARRARHAVLEVPIRTVYLDDNASSHFRPLVDSLRVYQPMVRFAASSLTAFAIDTAVLLALSAFGWGLAAAVVGARLVSGAANFAVNRSLVFGQVGRAGVATAAVRYAALASALVVANYLVLRAMVDGLGMPLLAAKVVTEMGLVVVSFAVQRQHVFVQPRRHRDAPSAAVPRLTSVR